MKWLRAEEESRHFKSQLQEANQSNLKLESQYHHTTVLLKNEIKVRAQLQTEKKTLVKTTNHSLMLNSLMSSD